MEDKLGKLTEGQRGYLAGLIDGEGCVTISKTMTKCRTPNYAMRVLVTQANEPYLRYWCKVVGLGAVTHQRGAVWQWQMCQQEAARFLRIIRPYVVMKCNQVDIALKFMQTKGLGYNGGGRKRTPMAILDLQERYRQQLVEAKVIDRSKELPCEPSDLEGLIDSQLCLL